MIPKNIKEFVEGGKKTRFKKGLIPWNYGKAKKYVCQSCGKEIKNKSHGKPKFCKNCIGQVKKNNMSRVGKSRMGKPSWNKGKPNTWSNWKVLQTKESREKMRLAKIGKPSPFKGKVRPELRGKNNPLWKGGSGTIRHQLMQKIEYKLWRLAVFTRDNYTCQMCGQRGGTLNADHIKSWANYPELRFAIDNGRTLCISCHRQTETWGAKVLQISAERN